MSLEYTKHLSMRAYSVSARNCRFLPHYIAKPHLFLNQPLALPSVCACLYDTSIVIVIVITKQDSNSSRLLLASNISMGHYTWFIVTCSDLSLTPACTARAQRLVLFSIKVNIPAPLPPQSSPDRHSHHNTPSAPACTNCED
jgi:hypothetical protein